MADLKQAEPAEEQAVEILTEPVEKQVEVKVDLEAHSHDSKRDKEVVAIPELPTTVIREVQLVDGSIIASSLAQLSEKIDKMGVLLESGLKTIHQEIVELRKSITEFKEEATFERQRAERIERIWESTKCIIDGMQECRELDKQLWEQQYEAIRKREEELQDYDKRLRTYATSMGAVAKSQVAAESKKAVLGETPAKKRKA